MTINCSVELGAAGKRPARADSPHLDPKGMLYVLLQPELGWRKELNKSIIVWSLYIGSIPIYDYSLGVRVHPPLYIAISQSGILCLICNKRSMFGI